MNEKKELLAYCGLYCGDCAGYSGGIANAAIILKDSLKKYKFSKTAEALFPEKFKDYNKFSDVLEFITELKCDVICRKKQVLEGGCTIRLCAIEKRYFGCYECNDFENCEKLTKLENLHGDSCIKNMKLINEIGLDAWINSDNRLWFGSEEK